MAVDQPQAVTLPRGQPFDKIINRLLRRAHKVNTLDTRV